MLSTETTTLTMAFKAISSTQTITIITTTIEHLVTKTSLVEIQITTTISSEETITPTMEDQALEALTSSEALQTPTTPIITSWE